VIVDNPVVYPPQFTAGQLDVLRELASGKTEQRIALDLGEPRSTVHKRITRMYQLIQVSSRVALVVWALKEGVLELGEIQVQYNYAVQPRRLERWNGETMDHSIAADHPGPGGLRGP
jgi:DNA-binding CsgD family transcriptional regulator